MVSVIAVMPPSATLLRFARTSATFVVTAPSVTAPAARGAAPFASINVSSSRAVNVIEVMPPSAIRLPLARSVASALASVTAPTLIELSANASSLIAVPAPAVSVTLVVSSASVSVIEVMPSAAILAAFPRTSALLASTAPIVTAPAATAASARNPAVAACASDKVIEVMPFAAIFATFAITVPSLPVTAPRVTLSAVSGSAVYVPMKVANCVSVSVIVSIPLFAIWSP